MEKKTLEQRVRDLEFAVYREWIEDCPRCKAHTMNDWQKDICRMCAYKKGDPL